MMQKLLDVSKINKLGWKAKIPLIEGIKRSYIEYLRQIQLKKNEEGKVYNGIP